MKSIVEFVKLLRNANVRISIAEAIDSCRALTVCDCLDREQFRISLKTTLIKRVDDIETFDRVFDLFFAEPIDRTKNEKLTEEEFQECLEEMQELMNNEEFNNQDNQDNQDNQENNQESGQKNNQDQGNGESKNGDGNGEGQSSEGQDGGENSQEGNGSNSDLNGSQGDENSSNSEGKGDDKEGNQSASQGSQGDSEQGNDDGQSQDGKGQDGSSSQQGQSQDGQSGSSNNGSSGGEMKGSKGGNGDECGGNKGQLSGEEIIKKFEHSKKQEDEAKKNMYKYGSESEIKQAAQQLANSRRFEDWETENITQIINHLLIRNNYEYMKAMAKNESRKSQHESIEEKHIKLKKFLREEVEKAIVKQYGKDMILAMINYDDLMDKDLRSLSEEEVDKMESIIKKMTKKIATHITCKEKRSNHGKIDIKRTIKSSISRYGNTCGDLKFKDKKREKPELVVLCDISGSVYMYVGFMLQILIGIQNVFSKVRSYVFIDRPREITGDVDKCENFDLLINFLMEDSSLGYGTDYSNVFDEMSQLDGVFNKKSILVIIGDAENTGREVGDDYLKTISDNCKTVFWLNPKDKDTWYNNSDLDKYEKHCGVVSECNTMRKMEDFVSNLIRVR